MCFAELTAKFRIILRNTAIEIVLRVQVRHQDKVSIYHGSPRLDTSESETLEPCITFVRFTVSSLPFPAQSHAATRIIVFPSSSCSLPPFTILTLIVHQHTTQPFFKPLSQASYTDCTPQRQLTSLFPPRHHRTAPQSHTRAPISPKYLFLHYLSARYLIPPLRHRLPPNHP
jgi:hypothetical protein